MHSHTHSPAERVNFAKSRLGILLSAVCAVHCVATPIVFLVAPTLSQQIVELEWIEWAAFALAAGMMAFQLWPEYGFHRKPDALLLSSFGLLVLLAGIVAEIVGLTPWVHSILGGVGSVFIAIGFYKAHRLRHHPKALPAAQAAT